jgi:hypothetical protein
MGISVGRSASKWLNFALLSLIGSQMAARLSLGPIHHHHILPAAQRRSIQSLATTTITHRCASLLSGLLSNRQRERTIMLASCSRTAWYPSIVG